MIVNQAVALEASGLFDGIMLDWWNDDVEAIAAGLPPTHMQVAQPELVARR